MMTLKRAKGAAQIKSLAYGKCYVLKSSSGGHYVKVFPAFSETAVTVYRNGIEQLRYTSQGSGQ